MAEVMLHRLHAIVEGEVQGVSFRYFVVDRAGLLKVNGWVRNRWDGTVEVVAEGEQQTLDNLLSALRRGPPAAHVMGVQSEWQEATGEFKGFHIRPTV